MIMIFSFEHPVYSNGYFLGFDGWDDMNKKYSMGNVSYIVRVEFARDGTYKENRLKRHFKRFWLPGAIWVERNVRFHHIYRCRQDGKSPTDMKYIYSVRGQYFL